MRFLSVGAAPACRRRARGAAQVGLRMRRRGRGRAPGRPARASSASTARRSSSVEVRSACGPSRARPPGRGLGGIRPQPPAQLVALGQRRGVGVLGHRHRPPDGVQPHQVGVDGRRVGRHRPEGRHVGHGEPRGRGDLGHAPCREVTQRRAARLQLGAQGPGPGLVVGVGPAVRGADDEVALGAGGVLLQGPEEAADVGAALDPGAARRPTRVSSRASIDEAAAWARRRLAVDEVPHPLDRGAQRAQPRAGVGLRRVDAQPGPQRGGQRVGQPAGLGSETARHRRRCGRRPTRGARRGRVEPPPDEGGQALQLGRARPGPSPRSPPAGRGGRPPPSTAPSRAAGRR